METKESNMEKLILIGYGGHAKSIVDCITKQNKYAIIGYTDIVKRDTDFKYLGTDDVLGRYYETGVKNAFICMGYLGGLDPRRNIYHNLKKIGYALPTIIDQSAIVACDVKIQEGCFIGKGAIINTSVQMEKMVTVNSGSIIEHECKVGMFSHISVGAVLGGQVIIDDSSFIGANATLIQGVKVGTNSIIGAGSVVIENVESNSVVVGNPAKEIRKNIVVEK